MKSRNILLQVTTLAFAVLYCLALIFLRDKGVLVVLGGAGALVALYYSSRYPTVVLGLVIVVIGLCPFFASVRIFSGLPKLYADDLLFFYVTAYMIVFYGFLRKKKFHIGSASLLVFFFIFLVATCVPFFTEPLAKSAIRNFTETVILGFFFYIVYLNETEENNIDKLISYVAITTLCLSLILCVEVMAQSNPLMKAAEKMVDDFVYLAPSYYKFLGTYYRPYAVYFHPSEAGTFVAMGLPFVYYTVRDKHPLLKYAALALAGAGVVLNFTRGVWIAMGIAILVCNFSRIKRYLPAAAAAGILALGVFALSMSDSGFGKRVFDPSNLSNRLYYWKVGYNMFINYFPFGIGHMNFKTRYLEFVDTEPAPPGLEVKEVFVADNVFLTTLVEHGILGFAAQMAFYIASIWMIAKVSRMYRRHGDAKNALRLNIFLQAALIYLLAGTFADVQLFAKVTKMFFIILGMAMAVCRFAPAGGATPSVQSEPAGSASSRVGGSMRPLPNTF